MAPSTSHLLSTTGVLPAVRYEFLPRVELQSPWHVRAIDVTEELSGAFVAAIDLENDSSSADPEELLSQGATLVLSRLGAGSVPLVRQFSGVVRRFQEVAHCDRRGRRFCRVFVEPALACLKNEIRTAKYQDMSVPDVLREVLSGIKAPYARPFDLQLLRLQEREDSWRRYAVRDLCVQYGESTYDFLRRIMAEEGITYFFNFDGTLEKMVLVDENLGFHDLPFAIPFRPVDGKVASTETIYEFMLSREDASGQVACKTFDHTRHLELSATKKREPREGEPPMEGALEIYDARPNATLYGLKDDEYTKTDLELQAALRLERARVRSAVGSGRGDVIAFSPGHQFVLDGEATSGFHLGGKYLLTSVRHQGHAPDRVSTADAGRAPSYSNEFTCIPADVSFRPQTIRKPTAVEDYGIVVSASPSDPIWTDKHGRVRVRFLQVEGQADLPPKLCSPWIPVSQLWAGGGYGLQLIPRAGMLVRIRYREGDPDRPYVAGCLPTARQTLPSMPPEQKTRSTWRSRSLRDGGNDLVHYNEITMEDAAEKEELFIHAGRNLRRKVRNDSHTTIDRDERRVIGRKQTIEVKGRREKRVHGDENILVKKKRSAIVKGDDTRHVHGKDTQTVERDQTVTVHGTRTTTIHKHETATYLEGREQRVTGDDSLHVSGTLTTTADEEWKAGQGPSSLTLKEGNAELKAGAEIKLSADAASLLLAQGSATIQAEKKVELASGESSFVMTPGKIEISSPELSLTGANGSIKLDGSGVTTTGLNVSSKALAKNELTGAVVKAN